MDLIYEYDESVLGKKNQKKTKQEKPNSYCLQDPI